MSKAPQHVILHFPIYTLIYAPGILPRAFPSVILFPSFIETGSLCNILSFVF
jgi:hypothetical protein